MQVAASLTSQGSILRTDRPWNKAASGCSRHSLSSAPRRHRTTHCHKEGLVVASQGDSGKTSASTNSREGKKQNLADALGVGLGPIALSFQEDQEGENREKEETNKGVGVDKIAEAAGVSLGPIALSLGDSAKERQDDGELGTPMQSIAPVTTEEWRKAYENEEGVDLWAEDDFNAPSRLQGGVDLGADVVNIENKAMVGSEYDPDVPVYSVKITDPVTGHVYDVDCPDDRYILFEAEEKGLKLPNACRNGCCTQCAVKIKSGELYQPEALGVSKELQQQGYALLCVAYPDTNLEVELQDPDEVYQMQFGAAFEAQATSKNLDSIDRDDFALELAQMDE